MIYSGKVLSGKPYPLGATYDGSGVNFAIFSELARGVTLCLYEMNGDNSRFWEVVFRETTNYVWHAYLPGIEPGQRYGYRVDGLYRPKSGIRFNRHKVLIDPYARAIEGRIDIKESMFDYTFEHRSQGNVYEKSELDSGVDVNKCIVIDGGFDWEGTDKPDIPMHETIIYELHVKGFTALHPEIPVEERGTYKGLANQKIINYFRELGITTIELMPVHHFVHSKFVLDNGLSNYWGYNSIGFFAPHAEFSAAGMNGEQVTEFKEMVKAYHRNGIEIILDVVYNHTGESDYLGPTIALKGFDNPYYYRTNPFNRLHYEDFTGTGNTLNLSKSWVLQLVMDSLRYWAEEMQVDGFRFDLASALTRGAEGKIKGSGFLDAVHQDPVLSKLKLIAEPWDLGQDGYQVGNFPAPWSEWNGKYRDGVRRYWRGDENQVRELALRFSGSPDLYEKSGRLPGESINFVTAHDGFTLHDLVSYNQKYNRKNWENNKDGEDHNISWNSGVEGPTDDPDIIALREKRKRNFLGTLLLSQGVPMISHGDEYGRSQQGNNNVWCQDNETAWMDWTWNEHQKQLFEFTKRMIALRKEHHVTHCRKYLKNRPGKDLGAMDVRWFNTDGVDMSSREWESGYIRCMGILLNSKLINDTDQLEEPISDKTLLILFNSFWEEVSFRMPQKELTAQWKILFDTDAEPTREFVEIITNTYQIQPRSMVLLQKLQ